MALDGRVRVLGTEHEPVLPLDLLACGYRKQIREASWAAKLRRFLEGNDGRPPARRPHDDQLGSASP